MYFIVHVSGMVTDQGLSEYSAEVVRYARESGLKRVLLDERRASHEADMFRAYQVGESEEVANMAPEGFRFACVPAPENRQKNDIFETLMRNRSVTYRVFDTICAAEAWLLA